MTILDADIPTFPVPSEGHAGILFELNEFNREALAIQAEAETLRPMSEWFTTLGEKLERIVAAGIENLTLAERDELAAGLNKSNEFRAAFEPRLNALFSRQEKHLEHQKDLMARLKQLNMLAQPAAQFSTN